jgi:transcriptional repressor NrdR
MQCVVCKEDNDRVVDSRSCESGSAIRRRRKCLACGRRFTTYERMETTLRTVIKKDGRREPFNRDKVLGGLRTACQKRQISRDQLGRIVDRIEQEVFGESDREVSTRSIGERVIEELKTLDKVAYVRFASVYREFTDVLEFATFLMPFLPPEARAGLLDAGPLSAGQRQQIPQNGRGAYGGDVPGESLLKKDRRNGSHPGGT